MADSQPSPYRFVIVFAVALAAFLSNFSIFQMAGLAGYIIPAAGLDSAKFGLVIGISILTAAVLGMPLGALGDRVGVKPVVAAAIAITLVGAVGRWWAAPSFGGYLFWMFLIGATNAALNANFIKVIGVWLRPSEIGVGVGCYLSGIGLGTTVAIATGPMFPAMKPAFLVCIVLAAVVLGLWLALIKNPPNLPKMEPMPMSQSLKYVVSKRDIWVGGFGIFFLLGTYVVATSFAGQFLITHKGVAEKTAQLLASSIAFLMLIGGLISDKTARIVGSSRIFLFLTGVIAAGGSLMALWLPYGALTVVGLFLLGLGCGLFCSYILALPMLLSYIGPAYAGSAGGLISTLMSAGGFALPYVFPVLAGGNLDRLMIWIAVGFLLMGSITLALPELVRKPAQA